MVAVQKHQSNIISIAKRCPICGLPAFSARATYCSKNGRCKQKAYNERRRNKRNVTNITIANLEQKITYLTDLVEHLAVNGISTNTPQNKHHATPEITLSDLSELQAKKAKSTGQSRVNLLNSMAAMTGTKKLTIKPEAKNNIIAGSDKPLSEPVFDGLGL